MIIRDIFDKEEKKCTMKAYLNNIQKLSWLDHNRASVIAQLVNNLPAMCETWVRTLGW